MDQPSSTPLTEECRATTFRRRSTDDEIILIVDDMPENLSVLGELLHGAGYHVKVATNVQILSDTCATCDRQCARQR